MKNAALFVRVLFIDSSVPFCVRFVLLTNSSLLLLITSVSHCIKAHESPFTVGRKRVYENRIVISLLCNIS